jgi:hypothetical protein
MTAIAAIATRVSAAVAAVPALPTRSNALLKSLEFEIEMLHFVSPPFCNGLLFSLRAPWCARSETLRG